MSGREEVEAVINSITEYWKLNGEKPQCLEISTQAYDSIKTYLAPLPSFKDPEARRMMIGGVLIKRKP